MFVAEIAAGATEFVVSLNREDFNLQIIAISLDGISLPPLLNTSLGFLDTVSVNQHMVGVTSKCLRTAFSGQYTLDQYLVFKHGTRIVQLVASLSVILFVVGGLALGAAVDEYHLDVANTIRRAGYVIIAIVYTAVVGVVVYSFLKRGQVLKYRREVRHKL